MTVYKKSYNLSNVNIMKRVSNVINSRGLWYFIKKAFYIYLFPFYAVVFHKKRKIVFKGEEFSYFYHSHNHTWANERAIEIPLVLSRIKGIDVKDILEVGNVLSYYMDVKWSIIDKYEVDRKVINEDIASFNPKRKYKTIISISTMEHVGFDEEVKDEKKILRALDNLKNRCLAKGGSITITMPIGWNPNVDKLLLENKIVFDETYYFKRDRWDNRWTESSKEDALGTMFAKPYIGANGLVLGIIRK